MTGGVPFWIRLAGMLNILNRRRKSLDILIPTNSRPECLRRCLDSLALLDDFKPRILVADSTPARAPAWIKSEYDQISRDHRAEVTHIGENLGPSASRRWLVENSKSDFLLFLDDDHVCTPSVIRLFNLINRANADIVSGAWLEASYPDHSKIASDRQNVDTPADVLESGATIYTRAVGNNYSLSPSCSPEKVVVKTPVLLDLSETFTVGVDECLPTMLARRAVFKEVHFDTRYGFAFEWFDFFLQCRKKKLQILADTSVLFWHLPVPYAASTSRHESLMHADKARFTEKWGMAPVFSKCKKLDLAKDSVFRALERG